MVHVYEKVCKTDETPEGLIEITDGNPLAMGPCLIVIPFITLHLDALNSYMTDVAKLVNPQIDTSYNPNRRVLGFGYGDYYRNTDSFSTFSPGDNEIKELVDKYFWPLLIDNGQRVDVQTAMKRLRNITFLTHCDGTKQFLKIEEALKEKMRESKMYTESETKLIFSQVCVAAISSNVLINKETSALAFTFGDINDRIFSYSPNTTAGVKRMNSAYIRHESSVGYAIVGNGKHFFKDNLINKQTLSARIQTFLNTSLDNALGNMHSDTIIPITYEKMDNALDNATEQQTHRF